MANIEPGDREEMLLRGILDGATETNVEPGSREEILLKGILEGVTETNIEPGNRKEALLRAILEKGGGGGGGGGGEGAVALLRVIYESGQTCTCVKDDITLVSDTSGDYIFSIPETGTWTLTSIIEGITETATVTLGMLETATVNLGIDFLKQRALATGYCAISNTNGDKFLQGNRWFQRNSTSPIVLLVTANGTGSYRSYGVLTKENEAPSGSSSGWGNLISGGTVQIGNNTFYVWVMAGMTVDPTPQYYLDGNTSPITLDNSKVSVDTVNHIMIYDSDDVRAEFEDIAAKI